MKGLTIIIAMVMLATLAIAAQTGNVLVSWNANSETDLKGYHVFFNGSQIADVQAPAHTWSGSVTLIEGTNTAQVSAYDATGNESAKSAITLASSYTLDTTAPAVPTGCTVSEPPGRREIKKRRNNVDNFEFWGRAPRSAVEKFEKEIGLREEVTETKQ